MIVACREAVVSEAVPEGRLDPRYLRRRALRAGHTYGELQLRQLPGLRRWLFTSGALAVP